MGHVAGELIDNQLFSETGLDRHLETPVCFPAWLAGLSLGGFAFSIWPVQSARRVVLRITGLLVVFAISSFFALDGRFADRVIGQLAVGSTVWFGSEWLRLPSWRFGRSTPLICPKEERRGLTIAGLMVVTAGVAGYLAAMLQRFSTTDGIRWWVIHLMGHFMLGVAALSAFRSTRGGGGRWLLFSVVSVPLVGVGYSLQASATSVNVALYSKVHILTWTYLSGYLAAVLPLTLITRLTYRLRPLPTSPPDFVPNAIL